MDGKVVHTLNFCSGIHENRWQRSSDSDSKSLSVERCIQTKVGEG
jgi:hypothetical protein